MTQYFENEIEWLYYQLWTKSDANPQRFCFIIPDTVVYRKGLPHTWYFSTMKDGTILKKNHQNVTAKKVWKMMIQTGRTDNMASATTYTYANEKATVDSANEIGRQRNYLLLEHFT